MKKINRSLCLMLSLLLIIGSTIFAMGASENIGSEDMIPIRTAFEAVGIKTDWQQKSKTALLGESGELQFTAGSKTMIYDGISYEMNKEARLINGTMCVPADTLETFFGATIIGRDAVIPEYVAEVLTGSYKTKLELYQEPAEGEEAFLSALKPDTGWQVARDLAKIGSSNMGFRLGGTPEGKAAAEIVYKKYEELGLEPVYDTFKTYGWRYLDSSFKLKNSDVEIPVVSAVGTKATPEAGVTGEIVYIGTASKQELKGVDLNGKIALIKMDLDVHPWQSQGAYAAAVKGAVGVIYYCENYYSQYEGGEAFNVQDWSGTEIDIPVLNTPKKYGEKLVEMVTKEPFTGTIFSNVEINEKGDGYNVIGKIKGSKYPDEYVMVNAHTDAHFQGFQDDSIAIGAMIAIAEAMKNSNYKPDRTILFLSMDAEEFGAIDLGPDWLLGSWNMMKTKNKEWAGKTVASMTIELFAYEGTKNFELRASDTLYEYVLNTAKGFDYKAYDGLGIVKNEISNMSDEFSMAYYGIPTFRTNTDPFVVKNIYHSQFDNEETTSFEKYSEAISHYAKLILRADRLSVAPYDLTLGIKKYNNAVNYAQLKALGLGSELQSLASAYQQKATALYFKNAMILKLYDKAKRSGKDVSPLEKQLVAYNQKVRETTRQYLTGTLAMAGETVALEIPFYQGLPKLFDDAILALEKNDGATASKTLSALKGSYYADFEDYETWAAANIDNINPDDPNRDILWTEGIRLQFFDHYKMTQGLKEKLASGETRDYSEEIKACKEFKEVSLKNLKQAYVENMTMFKSVNKLFPLDEADKLIEALK